MDSSLDNIANPENKDTTELFFDLNLCFNAASVLKYICLTNNTTEHSQLIQLEVVPKLMRILSVIKDFLDNFRDGANFEYTYPSFCTDQQKNQLAKPVYRMLPHTATSRLFREICGSISNCCQCLANLQSILFNSTAFP